MHATFVISQILMEAISCHCKFTEKKQKRKQDAPLIGMTTFLLNYEISNNWVLSDS